MTATPQLIPVWNLQDHPQNPRLALREDVVSAIVAGLSDGFDPAHALIVRPLGNEYQVLSGHHRKAAAMKAGIDAVPCWVRELDDEGAYMALATSNSQGELSPLEIGMHALHCVEKAQGKRGGGLAGYAEAIGKHKTTVGDFVQAARVFSTCSVDPTSLSSKTAHLSTIHSLPTDHWASMVDLMLEHGWSVKDTQAAVERVKSVVAARPAWFQAALPVARIAIEPSFAKTVLASLATLAACHDRLPDVVTLYSLHDTDETKEINGREHRKREAVPQEFSARAHFEAAMAQADLTSARAIEGCYRDIARRIDAEAHASEAWVPVLTDAEEKARAGRAEELARLQDREAFMPRLLHGDVVEQLRALPDAHFDLVCIDPPYNMDKAGWDSFGSGRDFAEWARPWLKECQRVLKDSGAIYVFGINRMLSHLQHEMDGLGLHYRNWITWDTIQGAGGGLWVNRTEAILYYSKTADTFEDADAVKLERHEENVREYKGREYFFKNPSNIWRFPCVDDKHPERTEHPTQKPVELIERIVRASSPVGGRVLDCFLGSGTTGVACMRARRHATGIDQSAQYIAIAQARFDATEVPAA